jgi:hypothetical protein
VKIPATLLVAVVALFNLPGCAMISRHQFVEPAINWQTRSGQLLYRNAKRTLIGEVYVRFSNRDEFELTFSKGSGVTLLTLRQDAKFAEVRGALTGRGWSGPIERSPPQLRGWLHVRDKIIKEFTTANLSGGGQDRQSIRYATAAETFLFHF